MVFPVNGFEFWVMVQIALEGSILALMVLLLLSGRWGRRGREAELLKERISQADAAVMAAYEKLNGRFTDLKDLLKRLQKKEDVLIGWMERADRAAEKIRLEREGSGEKAPAGQRYSEVVRLIERGVSHQEIARSTGVSEGEIDLIRRLKGLG